MEETIVRDNLINQEGYTPHCGNVGTYTLPFYVEGLGSRIKPYCSNPRTEWNTTLNQFVCPKCGWISEFPNEFINRYKAKWNK